MPTTTLAPFPPPSTTQGDIFSLSDIQLSETYQFLEEIGFGNWGSVWLCQPKKPEQDGSKKVAVKLVHRSKTSTTAARVRSLWNEMKIVRSFTSDPHPSIVLFHSFIITPSYALITMEYLPQLVPVEVGETKAREWFRSLLSGVNFLHERGVVHNDIKPANILLSTEKVPVLVDFGFAERYELASKKAFLSNLAYGTPEYLSPERARGNLHDTRKSDIWSLGVTFFEILIGRTPFEYTEGEQFSTKEDLERYWARTVKGKWVGEWQMSKGVEKLLRRMTSPNADLRLTSFEAMRDPYWMDKPASQHKKISSALLDTEINLSKLIDSTPPWLSRKKSGQQGLTSTEHIPVVPAQSKASPERRLPPSSRPVARIKSYAHPPSLSPVKASPRPSPRLDQNVSPRSKTRYTRGLATSNRHNISRKPVPVLQFSTKANPQAVKSKESKEPNKKAKVLTDVTSRATNNAQEKHPRWDSSFSKLSINDSSKDRVRDFEKLKELVRENLLSDESDSEENQPPSKPRIMERAVSLSKESRKPPTSPTSPLFWKPPSTQEHDTMLVNSTNDREPGLFPNISLPRSVSGSGLSILRHGVKSSIDKTIRLYKSSTLNVGKAPTARKSFDSQEDDSKLSASQHESWEVEAARQAKSSLPVVHHAVRNDQIAAASKADRMTIWIKNVEQVVKDAQENFASSGVAPLPPLPARPVSQIYSRNPVSRPNRVPRKIIPANQIFAQEPDKEITTPSGKLSDSCATPDRTVASDKPEEISFTSTSEKLVQSAVSKRESLFLSLNTTVREPDGADKSTLSPKLLSGQISPVHKLNYEVEHGSPPRPTPSLSSMLNPSIFKVVSGSTPALHEIPSIPTMYDASFTAIGAGSPLLEKDNSMLRDSTTLRQSTSSPALSSPVRQKTEAVYDRFLMASSGVRRVGKGYQNESVTTTFNAATNSRRRSSKFFPSIRKAMPPAISSDDMHFNGVDESGVLTWSPTGLDSHPKEGTNTVRLVKDALKAIVTGKPISRRQSKVFQ